MDRPGLESEGAPFGLESEDKIERLVDSLHEAMTAARFMKSAGGPAGRPSPPTFSGAVMFACPDSTG